MAQSPICPEELLSHADFVRGLARTLILDEHLADDVAQEVWMAALKQAPDSIKYTRSWISGTLRNLIRMVKRGESRRRTRERVVALPEGLPSTEEVVAQEEMRNKVVGTVLALEEPLRMPVLLRYYQNLSHEEIASRLEIPLETMRTRLKRGLALLRNKLDREYGGREQWCLVLAPYAGLQLIASEADAAEPRVSESTLKHILLGILIVGLPLVLWLVFPFSGDEASSPGKAVVEWETDTAVGQKQTAEVNHEDPPAGKITQSREAVLPEGKTVSEPSLTHVNWKGRVIDFTGDPLGGVVIRIAPVDLIKPRLEGVDLLTSISDEAGCFEVRGLQPGSFQVDLRFPWQEEEGDPQFLAWNDLKFENQGLVEMDIHLLSGEGGFIHGKVLDEATGFPIKETGFRVTSFSITRTLGMYNPIFQAPVNPEDGSFCLRCLIQGNYSIQLNGPDAFTEIWSKKVAVNAGEVAEETVLLVPPRGKIHLVLLDFTDEDIKNMDLRFFSKGRPMVHYQPALKGEDWTFSLAEGFVQMELEIEGALAVHRSFQIVRGELREAVIMKSELKPKGRTTMIKGCIKKPDLTPLPHAWLCLLPEKDEYENSYNSVHAPNFLAITDEQGCFTLAEVPAGRWTLICHLVEPGIAGGMPYEQLLKTVPHPLVTVYFHDIMVSVGSEKPIVVERIIPPSTMIGSLVDGTTGGPLNPGTEIVKVKAVDGKNKARTISEFRCREGGSFELHGIPEGECFLIVMAPPFYLTQQSSLFTVDKTVSYTLGSLGLTPSGVVDVLVMDEAGDPVLTYSMEMEGPDLTRSPDKWGTVVRERGLTTVTDLPLSEVVFHIYAKGFQEKKVHVLPEPMTRMELKVVLTRQ